MQKRVAVAAASGVLAATSAYAHHSPAAYDVTKQVVIEGTLTRVDWTNPHIYLTVATVGPNGQQALRQVESVSVPSAQSTGLTRASLVVGSSVVVRGHPNRRGGGYTVLGADITTSDGVTYALGASGRPSRPPTATVRATGLSGRWAPQLDPRLVPTVQGWPLNERGRAALAAVLSNRTTLTVGCTAVPPPMLMQLPQMRTIDVGTNRVTIDVDFDGVGATRIVRLDLAEHPADVAPSLLGHSIGTWEGGTLVIDTIGFSPHELGIGFGIPASAGKHLRERLTLSADGLQVRYELTVDDPEYLATPATYTALWNHRPELAASGLACDPQTAERYRED